MRAAACQIRTIDRVCEIPHEGPFCDLMWSDPEDIETWAVSPRGAGWLFGRKVTSEFNQINGEEVHWRAAGGTRLTGQLGCRQLTDAVVVAARGTVQQPCAAAIRAGRRG